MMSSPRTSRCIARATVFALALSVGARSAVAEFELALLAGLSLPTYEQTFAFDVDDLVGPDLPISSSGGFDLKLEGGAAFSGAFTWRFSERWGVEARVDSAQVDLEVQGGRISGDLGDVIPGLPSVPLSADLSGQAQVDSLTPLSLNLQFVRGERLRFVASGGLSYMPGISVSASVSALLDVGAVPNLTLPELSVTAAANLESGFGGNLGVGLRYGLGESVSLALEGRAFLLPKRTLEWGSTGGSQSPIEEALAEALDPIEFEYGFFQVTGGVAFTF